MDCLALALFAQKQRTVLDESSDDDDDFEVVPERSDPVTAEEEEEAGQPPTTKSKRKGAANPVTKVNAVRHAGGVATLSKGLACCDGLAFPLAMPRNELQQCGLANGSMEAQHRVCALCLEKAALLRPRIMLLCVFIVWWSTELLDTPECWAGQGGAESQARGEKRRRGNAGRRRRRRGGRRREPSQGRQGQAKSRACQASGRPGHWCRSGCRFPALAEICERACVIILLGESGSPRRFFATQGKDVRKGRCKSCVGRGCLTPMWVKI